MKKQVVIHPILFSLFPSLFLLGVNSSYYEFAVVVAPGLTCVAIGLLAWYVARMLIRDQRVAAILVSSSFLVMFSFAAVYDSLTRARIAAQGYASHAIPRGDLIIVVCLGVGMGATVLMLRLRQYMNEWTYLMNVVGTILVFVPLTNLAASGYGAWNARQLLPATATRLPLEKSRADDAAKPDIYHIILDGYGSDEVFRRVFDSDNSEMTGFLRQKGFWVARHGRSNYPETASSVASMMNAVYLHDVVGGNLAAFGDHQFLRELMADNFAQKFLRANGYRIVAFGTAYENVRLRNPDVSLDEWWAVRPFALAVFEMTPFPWVLRQLGYPLLYDLHRKRILHTLDQLGEAPRLPGPKFVYAHILFAHTPFVFGRNGEPIDPERRFHMWVHGDLQENIDGYRNQVHYLNGRLRKTVENILERSARPPIILIHGDHGPGMKDHGRQGLDIEERFGILYALFLPGAGQRKLAETATPVNAYRLIFNHTFGTSYPMLPDVSYYTPQGRPYAFAAVDTLRPPRDN